MFSRLVQLCFFVSLTSMLALAQAGRIPVGNGGLPTSPIALRLPGGARRLAGKAGIKTALPQASGLDFAPAVAYGSGAAAASSVVVTDVNGDGIPDLVLVNFMGFGFVNNGSVGVLLGRGEGTFQTAMTYSSGGDEPGSVAVADVNGDGNPDLIVANYCADFDCTIGTVGVLLGNGDGTFQTAATNGSGAGWPESVTVKDVNGDGKPDVIVANYMACGYCSYGVVGVLLGNGDGSFQPVVTYNSDGGAASIAADDVNGDGKPDLLVSCAGGLVDVLLGNGDGTFQTAVTYDSARYGDSVLAVGDVNDDGKPDIVVTSLCADSECTSGTVGTVGVLLGNGDGSFQAAASYGSGAYLPVTLALGDVNGDGKQDLAVANECASSSSCGNGLVGVLLGNGDGTFQTAVTYDSGGYRALSVAVANVNGDDKPDLLVTNCGSAGSSDCASGSVGVLINTTITPTTTALISSPNPCNFGQAVTFTATVTSQAFNVTPTGSVSFLDGTTILGSSPLDSGGVATFSSSTLAIGTHSITATYSGDSNFAGSTSSVLSQVVQGAIVQINPTSVNFGNQTVGGLIKQGVLINVSNTGNTALSIFSIGITGDTVDFSETNQCPTTLQPGGFCTINAFFAPLTVGTKNAAVTITDSASDSPQSVSLTGTGVLPAVALSPTSLTFATQVVFTTSKAQTVTLTNTGLGILSITRISATVPFKQTNNCASTVNPGNSCTLSVTFSPTKAGSQSGTLAITDNAPASPQKVSLKGTGTDLQLTPTSLDFGNQPVGTRSLPKRITLSNKSSTTVTITGITIVGTNASNFAQSNTCGASVAGGASCSITVTFTPSAKGARSASISVSDNGGGSPQTVKLSGTGT